MACYLWVTDHQMHPNSNKNPKIKKVLYSEWEFIKTWENLGKDTAKVSSQANKIFK